MEGKDKEKEEALVKKALVKGKDKEKEEALVKKALVKGKKNKGSKRKLPANTKNKEKPVNKNKVYTIEKITNHKCAGRNKKVTSLLIKWEGYPQLTWESLSGINSTASGMVKSYLSSNKLKA